MNNEIESKAIKLASQNYAIEILTDASQEEGQCYFALNPELTGCMAQGSTIEEAIKNLEDARFDYIVSLLQDGIDIPTPKIEEISFSTTDCDSQINSETIQETIDYKKLKNVEQDLNSGQLASLFQISTCYNS